MTETTDKKKVSNVKKDELNDITDIWNGKKPSKSILFSDGESEEMDSVNEILYGKKKPKKAEKTEKTDVTEKEGTKDEKPAKKSDDNYIGI
jgi:hypothetical protein